MISHPGDGEGSAAFFYKPIVYRHIGDQAPHKGEPSCDDNAPEQVELPDFIDPCDCQHSRPHHNCAGRHEHAGAVFVDQWANKRCDRGLDDTGEGLYPCQGASVPAEFIVKRFEEETQNRCKLLGVGKTCQETGGDNIPAVKVTGLGFIDKALGSA